MNKKGFVLMETIIVIVVISVALLTLFSSYNKILTKLKAENKYDTSEYIYMTMYVKKALEGKIDNSKIADCATETKDPPNKVFTPVDFANGESYLTNGQKEIYNIKHIYILKNINSINEDVKTNYDKILQFDAYMIDYIRKLDVDNDETLIIVEYEKNDITDNNLNLKKTYIASLEW